MFTPKVLSITPAEANLTGILVYACTIPGTILCFLVLVAYATTACFQVARPHLDRITFRLLTFAMVFNVLYGVAFSVTAAQTGPGPLCNFGAFAVNLFLSFSTFFTACIALNLQLVLVHSFNGKRMEKYYVIGTIILSLALTVPAYGLGQLGWQSDNSTCWFRSSKHVVRLDWLIGSQSFWILFMATIETFCSVVVLWYIVGYEITLKAFRVSSQFTYGINTSGSSRRTKREQATQYRNVIIRIALYPIVSLMINYSTSILDIYSTIHGVHTQLDFRLLVLDLCLYGLRTSLYGVLAMGDPSFIRALGAIREARSKSQQSAAPENLNISPKFSGTESFKSRTTSTGPLAGNELERVVYAEGRAGERSGLQDLSRHPYGRGSKGVIALGCDGIVETPGDAIRRADLEDEEARDFCRQL